MESPSDAIQLSAMAACAETLSSTARITAALKSSTIDPHSSVVAVSESVIL